MTYDIKYYCLGFFFDTIVSNPLIQQAHVAVELPDDEM